MELGPEKYLGDIEKLKRENPDMVIIPGTESAAFYYWTGNYFSHDLVMNSWNKHLLIIGMKDPQDYCNLPVLSNPRAGVFNPVSLWPFILIAAAFLVNRFGILFIVGALLAYNNFPYRSFPFDQYHGEQGEAPYQGLIDYAASKNALVFWAHPDAVNYSALQKRGPISVVTPMYPDSLLDTHGYTGFAMYYEGYRKAGGIGGTWDQALVEYCSGKRQKPVWAAGELDYSKSSDPIDINQNILFVKNKTEENALEALKNGNFYVLVKGEGYNLRMPEFYVKSGNGDSAGIIMGQEMNSDKPVRVHLALDSTDFKPHKLKVNLIRDGVTIQVLECYIPNRLILEDNEKLKQGKHYYRVFIEENYSNKIVTNPVFVNRENALDDQI
jgi:hypothetical protein